jgi:hypothetical protein
MKVQLNDPKVTEESAADYRTEETEIVKEVNSRLGSRFQLGTRAPISTDSIVDLGLLSDNEAAQAVLDGTIVFPEGSDEATVKLLQEMAHIYLAATKGGSKNEELRLEAFQSYWKSAKERTSSSYSGRHMGHYKAASASPALAALHVGSINLAGRAGLPLDRWRKGVTCLLEKERGNCYVESYLPTGGGF